MKFGERAAELCGCAAALLGWRPAEFWAATPAELAAALGVGGDSEAAMDRGALERLVGLFPDDRNR